MEEKIINNTTQLRLQLLKENDFNVEAAKKCSATFAWGSPVQKHN